MPAPAAQPGEVSGYRTPAVVEDSPGEPLPRAGDDFGGARLGDGWTWVRRPKPATYAVQDGALHWSTDPGDLARDSDTAPVLLRNAPSGDYLVETRVRLDLPAEGCCFNFTQAGLVVYDDDDNYVKLTHVSIWETRQTEFAKELSDAPPGQGTYGNTVVGAPADWTYLRIAVERLDAAERRAAGGDTERYTAYTSQNGSRWVRGGTWTHRLGPDAGLGLVSMGGAGFTADFDYLRVHRLQPGSMIPRT
jgi:arabinan endo-1,5-alpha-L-arabinosidase